MVSSWCQVICTRFSLQGNLGVLNTTDRSYTTLMRSHTDTILCMAFDATRRHLATVSSDQTIRVWDMDTLAQLFDFRAPGEDPCTIAYHPQQQCFACGFVDGNVRVFHVGTTNLLAEHKQHRGKVTGLAFSPNGEYLYSAGSQGTAFNRSSHLMCIPALVLSLNFISFLKDFRNF